MCEEEKREANVWDKNSDGLNLCSIAQCYISLLSGMRNIDDRDHLVGQLTTKEATGDQSAGQTQLLP